MSRAPDERPEHVLLRAALGPGEEVRVVADLLELGNNVEERDLALPPEPLVDLVEVPRDHPPVVLPLQRRRRDTQHLLAPQRQRLLHLLLDAAQQVRLQLRLQRLDLPAAALQPRVLGLERLEPAERPGHQEVQQGPELARDEELALRLELDERVVQVRLKVLEPVRLVHNDVPPVDLPEDEPVLQDDLVRRQDDVELELGLRTVELVVPDHSAAPRVPDVRQHVQVRRPLPELPGPAGQRRQRHDDKERPEHVVVPHKPLHKGHNLDGLPEPHLVRKDPVHPRAVALHEPVEPLQLVVPQLPARKLGRLRGKGLEAAPGLGDPPVFSLVISLFLLIT